jgi:hypothetical protein
MGLLSSLFGEGGAGDNRAALEAVQGVPLPILKEYYPELYKQVVSLNPEMETAVNLGPSEMAGVATDPSLRQAQMGALNKLQEVGNAGGRDAQFMADQSRLESDINTSTQGQQGAIMQDLAARGMAGGGNELVARNMAAQQGANRKAQMAMDANAQAQQRALQAIMQGGQLGGQMQAQDFGQQAQKAQASDAINKFNAANQQQVMSNNVGMKNNAQQWNATSAQNVSNQNTGVGNEAKQYNLDLPQRNFDNAMGKATGVADRRNAIAAGKDKERDGEMQLVGNMVGAGANAYAGGRK